MTEPEFCVIICTLNRCGRLGGVLRSLSIQKTSHQWQVLVVDNGSEDETESLVKEHSSRYPVPLHFTQERKKGLSFARNHGLTVSRAEVVLFVDDDVICLPGWLEAHARAFADPKVVATGGKILPVLPEGTPDFMREVLLSENGGPGANYDLGHEPRFIGEGCPLPLPFGANMGLRRLEALEQSGFRTDLGWGRGRAIVGEETELLERLRKNGSYVLYVPEAVVEHHIDPGKTTFRYWRDYQTAYGRYLEITAASRTRFENLLRCTKYAWKVVRYSVVLWIRRKNRMRFFEKRARARGHLDVLVSRLLGEKGV